MTIVVLSNERGKPLKHGIIVVETMETKGFFQFEIIINVLVKLFLIHLNTYVMGQWPL